MIRHDVIGSIWKAAYACAGQALRQRQVLFVRSAAPEHLAIVERAVIDAAKVCIRFDDEIFRNALRGAGLADPLIEQYLESVSVIDDVFGMGKNPG